MCSSCEPSEPGPSTVENRAQTLALIAVAPLLVDVDIGQPIAWPSASLNSAHVERIGAAVLAQLRAAHAIAAATFVGIVIVEHRATARRASATAGATSSRTQSRNLLRHRAAQRRRRRHRHLGLIRQDDACRSSTASVAPHSPGPASIGSGWNSASFVSRNWQAEGCGARCRLRRVLPETRHKLPVAATNSCGMAIGCGAACRARLRLAG